MLFQDTVFFDVSNNVGGVAEVEKNDGGDDDKDDDDGRDEGRMIMMMVVEGMKAGNIHDCREE